MQRFRFFTDHTLSVWFSLYKENTVAVNATVFLNLCIRKRQYSYCILPDLIIYEFFLYIKINIWIFPIIIL